MGLKIVLLYFFIFTLVDALEATSQSGNLTQRQIQSAPLVQIVLEPFTTSANNTSDPNTTCSYCFQSYVDFSHLQSHVHHAHENWYAKCSVCTHERFKWPTDCHTHMKKSKCGGKCIIMTPKAGEPIVPFVKKYKLRCEYCGEWYNTSALRREHERDEHEGRCMKCEGCGKVFDQPHQCYNHLKAKEPCQGKGTKACKPSIRKGHVTPDKKFDGYGHALSTNNASASASGLAVASSVRSTAAAASSGWMAVNARRQQPDCEYCGEYVGESAEFEKHCSKKHPELLLSEEFYMT